MERCDKDFMRHAMAQAKQGFALGEVPVGCVLVYNGRILCGASNRVEATCDASQHAELVCMQRAAAQLGNWRLLNCTLYSTLEPCPMCAGAMILFRIDRLVYGAPDIRHGGIEVLERPHEIHQVAYCGGVLAQEAKALMQDFFKERRGRCAKSSLRN